MIRTIVQDAEIILVAKHYVDAFLLERNNIKEISLDAVEGIEKTVKSELIKMELVTEKEAGVPRLVQEILQCLGYRLLIEDFAPGLSSWYYKRT